MLWTDFRKYVVLQLLYYLTYKDKDHKDCVMLSTSRPRFEGTTPWTCTILAEDFSTLAVAKE